MLLSSIVETLDAELDRLERLREIVAELGVPVTNLVSSAKVAALLAEPENRVSELPPATPLIPEADGIPESNSKPVRRRKKAEVTAVEKVSKLSFREDAPVQSLRPESSKTDGAVDPEAGVPPVADDAPQSRKLTPNHVSVQVVSRPKPSMVVVSATEAARERESRAARQPAKRLRGDHHVEKPDAKPEDLARDLAARWLSGTGGSAELRGR